MPDAKPVGGLNSSAHTEDEGKKNNADKCFVISFFYLARPEPRMRTRLAGVAANRETSERAGDFLTGAT